MTVGWSGAGDLKERTTFASVFMCTMRRSPAQRHGGAREKDKRLGGYESSRAQEANRGGFWDFIVKEGVESGPTAAGAKEFARGC